MSATDGTSRLQLRDATRSWPVSQIAVASIGLVLALAILVFARRVAGAYSTPLPTLQLIVTAGVLCVWASIARRLASGSIGRMPATIAPFCVLLLFALACATIGGRVVDWLIWICALATYAITCIDANSSESHITKVAHDATSIEEEKGDHQLLQRITRYRDAEGRDVVHGEFIAEFASGERQVTLYAAFCPPFEHLPSVDVNVNDESEAVVKLMQVLHNGAQLEVRLPDPAEDPCQISIELYATVADS